MGIRFRCHHCEHELNLKEFQAGRRGRCPACSGRFRIPAQSTTFSLALEENEEVLASSTPRDETFNLKPSVEDAEAQPSRAPATRGRSSKAVYTPGSGKGSGRSQAHLTTPHPTTPHPTTPHPTTPHPTTPHPTTAAPATAAPSASPNPALTQIPAAVSEAPHAVWYVRPPSGGQYGPADAHAFLSWLQDNRVSADSLVWRDGWPQWMVAGEALEDHFGSQWRLAQPEAASGHVHGETEASVAVASVPGTAITSTLPGQEVEETRQPIQARRKKQQVNYAIFIAIMAILAIGLAVVLARVLLK